MIVKQITVFLENKPGQFADCISLLGEQRIDLQALSIAESQDYGLLRIIVDRPEETLKILRAHEWVCTMTEVLAVTVPDEPGSMIRIATVLADHSISLVYSYAFLSKVHGNACIILRVEDNVEATRILNEAGILC